VDRREAAGINSVKIQCFSVSLGRGNEEGGETVRRPVVGDEKGRR
jgi:hypothetical protein